ncbi:M24 family metallopeptidase [Jiella avicenniae]|uniref:M24 family metallopeptidase n=1 Tax=Jiella avicenniae TaxID=2907202 RepID=A0A9X1T608_9HYPH|nr:M24 family metallopeptidase [Jiella avicenniae]MCE7029409.1 M24 family metallopeptidase [Jiella avicenniae]
MANDTRSLEATTAREQERRWGLLREIMRAEKLDAVVGQSANNMTGTAGYLRWMTGHSAAGSYPVSAILPLDGPLVFIRHGAFGGIVEPSAERVKSGFGRIIQTPTFPAIEYSMDYDGRLIAEEVRRQGYRRIGILGGSAMYYAIAAGLRSELAGTVEIVDVTPQVDAVKAIKSAEEIELIRAAATMQDEVMAKLVEFIEPGRRDYEVTAFAQYTGQLLGSETGFFLGSSFSFPDGSLPLRQRSEQGRQIQKGDLVFILLENSGAGGMFTHMSRMISVGGPAPTELEDTFQKVLEVRRFNLAQMAPGRDCADIFAEYNAHMREHGYPEERRLHAHGQGLDVVERPLIRSDETMALAGNMNLGVHPFIFDDRKFVSCCDNYLLHEDGRMERLHACPEEILVA